VVILEASRSLPPALLWNETHGEVAPFDIRLPDGRIGPWAYLGDRDTCRRLAEVLQALVDRPAGMQTSENMLMVFEALGPSAHGYGERIELAFEALDKLDRRPAASA
jgi:hypothetical protein